MRKLLFACAMSSFLLSCASTYRSPESFNCMWKAGADGNYYRRAETLRLVIDQTKNPVELTFGHAENAELTGTWESILKEGKMIRFDGDDAQEPGTYDVFLYIDSTLLAGAAGDLVIRTPIESGLYKDPRQNETYPSTENRFHCQKMRK